MRDSSKRILRVIRALAEIAEIPSGLKTLYRARPRSIASLKIVEGLKLEGYEYKTVFDGGANIGQFARAVSTAFPTATVYSFEPLSDVAAQFEKNLADVSDRVHLQVCALGSADGEILFRRCSASQSSSALPIQGGSHDGLLAGVRETDQSSVPSRSLDSFVQLIECEAPILLKLDLQGYELEALKGARQLLSMTSSVLVEAVFKQAYIGEPLFDEIWDFLRPFGFRFRRPLSFVAEPSGEIVQIDALFSRA